MERLSTSAASINFSTLRKLVNNRDIVMLTTGDQDKYVMMTVGTFNDLKDRLIAYFEVNYDYLDDTDRKLLSELMEKVTK